VTIIPVPTTTCTPRPSCLDGIVDPLTGLVVRCTMKSDVDYCPRDATNGDANADGKIDLVDFDMWRILYFKNKFSAQVDFNKDNKIDMNDFDVWKNAYLTIK
jgi:hypothetical protein